MADNNKQITHAIRVAIKGNTTEFKKEIFYLIGNTTLRSLNLKSNLISGIVSIEGAHAMGSTTFKAFSNASRGDVVCAGLCIIATTSKI